MEIDRTRQSVRELAALLTSRGWAMATAESCTGGLVASLITDEPGSSAWFAGGVVAYANHVKQELLGVPSEVLAARGAVSRETVLAMARGAAERLGARCALAVSGVAGPTGGTPDKPVGTVWIAWALPGQAQAERFLFAGDRRAVREASALAALEGLAHLLRGQG